METVLMLFPVTLVVLLITIPALLFLGSVDAYRAYCAKSNACERFNEWYADNQNVYVGLAPEGVRLIGEWLDALEWYERTHPNADCSGIRGQLAELLNDLPPKSPNEFPFDERPPGARFYMPIGGGTPSKMPVHVHE